MGATTISFVYEFRRGFGDSNISYLVVFSVSHISISSDLLCVRQNGSKYVTSHQSSGSVNEASAPDMLTPTTLKNLTELFESDHCLKQVQAVENGEEFVTPQPPQEKRKKN